MAVVPFSESFVDRAPLGTHTDARCPGLLLRVTKAGRKYLFRGQVGDKRVMKGLGDPRTMSLDRAREKVRGYLDKADRGEDPFEKPKSLTLKELLLEYERTSLMKLKPATQRVYKTCIKQHLIPKLGETNPSLLSKEEGIRFHASFKGANRMANLSLAVLQAVLNLYDYPNPLKGIQRFREARRQTFLTESEQLVLIEWLERLETKPRTILHLLLLTGARKNEIVTLRRCSIVDDQRIAVLEDHKASGVSEKALVFSDSAWELLPLEEKNFLFPNEDNTGPYAGLDSAWRRLRKSDGFPFPSLRIHDLRHTFASNLVRRGASLKQVGSLLGQTQVSTTNRYAHLVSKDLRALLNEEHT